MICEHKISPVVIPGRGVVVESVVCDSISEYSCAFMPPKMEDEVKQKLRVLYCCERHAKQNPWNGVIEKITN